eukprot:COSAG03_NODE_1288_length_4397_cov_11.788041_7_plen_94_part_00
MVWYYRRIRKYCDDEPARMTDTRMKTCGQTGQSVLPLNRANAQTTAAYMFAVLAFSSQSLALTGHGGSMGAKLLHKLRHSVGTGAVVACSCIV